MTPMQRGGCWRWRRCLKVIPSCLRLDEAPSRAPARDAHLSRRASGGSAPDRWARATSGAASSAHTDHHRVPSLDLSEDPGRTQSPGLSLSLVNPGDHARQDRCDKTAHKNPPSMVRQAQVDRVTTSCDVVDPTTNAQKLSTVAPSAATAKPRSSPLPPI